jgi:hypothetical protein
VAVSKPDKTRNRVSRMRMKVFRFIVFLPIG